MTYHLVKYIHYRLVGQLLTTSVEKMSTGNIITAKNLNIIKIIF